MAAALTDETRAVLDALQVFRDEGATLHEAKLPGVEYSHGASATITLAEAVTYHDQALKERQGIETFSEGSEPERCVVVAPLVSDVGDGK